MHDMFASPPGDEHSPAPSEPQNAFEEMESRTSAAYTIYATARLEGEGAARTMHIALPMRQVESAPRGKGQRRAHGFTLVVEFDRPNGGRYQLRGWLGITKR